MKEYRVNWLGFNEITRLHRWLWMPQSNVECNVYILGNQFKRRHNSFFFDWIKIEKTFPHKHSQIRHEIYRSWHFTFCKYITFTALRKFYLIFIHEFPSKESMCVCVSVIERKKESKSFHWNTLNRLLCYWNLKQKVSQTLSALEKNRNDDNDMHETERDSEREGE